MGDRGAGSDPADAEESGPPLKWLSPPERRLAVKGYERWGVRLLADGRLSLTARERIALQSAYGAVACAWLAVWVPLLLLAALSSSHVAQVGFAIGAAPPAALSFLRFFQAWRAFPEMYRLPPKSHSAE